MVWCVVVFCLLHGAVGPRSAEGVCVVELRDTGRLAGLATPFSRGLMRSLREQIAIQRCELSSRQP